MKATELLDPSPPEAPEPPSGRREQVRRVASVLAGPALIAGCVLLVQREIAFGGMLSDRHPDLLSTFLPSWCYLGQSLSAGHIPAWNPHVMGGLPFAADPLSGWMYVPVMGLFSTLPCQLAMRWFIVLQPVMAGLGLYAFLRTEGASRPASTVGGLALALPLASPFLGFSLPFTAALAWTALTLAAASRLLRAEAWSRRVLWLILTALAWGQLGAAHLSHGLVPGTLALALYLVSRLVSDVRREDRSPREALLLAASMAVALPLLNAAYLLPRLDYLPESTLGLGYSHLTRLAIDLTGTYPGQPGYKSIEPTLPLMLSVPGGVYLGGIALGLVFAGWRARGLRHLAVAFALFGAASYVLPLRAVVDRLGPLVESSSVGSLYVHETRRLILGLILALAVLAAVGLEGWRQSRSWWERALLLAPAAVLWWVVPPILGFTRSGWLPVIGVAAGLVALVAVIRWPVALVVVALLVAAELTVNGFSEDAPNELLAARRKVAPDSLRPYLGGTRQLFPASDYLEEGLIVRTIRDDARGRYLSIAPERWRAIGYHVLGNRSWGLLFKQQSMLYGLEEGQGYNSVELPRYWTFLRAVDPKRIVYNAAGFVRPHHVALDLLQVAYVIQPAADEPAVADSLPLVEAGRSVLYELPQAPPRATVITSWRLERSSDRALRAVLAPGFDPQRTVILERDPGLLPATPGTAEGSAVYRWTGEQSARVVVDSPAPAIVLVRNVYHPGWHASVDGVATPILPADYLVQGIPVPAGHHTIVLEYDDPEVGHGLAASAAFLGVGAGLVVFLRRRERRNGRSSATVG